MKKSQIDPVPNFFDRYILLAEEDDLLTALQNSLEDLENLDTKKLISIGDKTYAEHKWTIKDIFQHLIDNERIQSTRALRIARHDSTPLPGYDENLYAKNAEISRRSLQDLIDELKLIRKSSIELFKSIDKKNYGNKGICSGVEITPLGLAFSIIGHQKHHLDIIIDRYYNLS